MLISLKKKNSKMAKVLLEVNQKEKANCKLICCPLHYSCIKCAQRTTAVLGVYKDDQDRHLEPSGYSQEYPSDRLVTSLFIGFFFFCDKILDYSDLRRESLTMAQFDR